MMRVRKGGGERKGVEWGVSMVVSRPGDRYVARRRTRYGPARTAPNRPQSPTRRPNRPREQATMGAPRAGHQ